MIQDRVGEEQKFPAERNVLGDVKLLPVLGTNCQHSQHIWLSKEQHHASDDRETIMPGFSILSKPRSLCSRRQVASYQIPISLRQCYLFKRCLSIRNGH